jgi:hypothetical protein
LIRKYMVIVITGHTGTLVDDVISVVTEVPTYKIGLVVDRSNFI